jgi:hypothetical protein
MERANRQNNDGRPSYKLRLITAGSPTILITDPAEKFGGSNVIVG